MLYMHDNFVQNKQFLCKLVLVSLLPAYGNVLYCSALRIYHSRISACVVPCATPSSTCGSLPLLIQDKLSIVRYLKITISINRPGQQVARQSAVPSSAGCSIIYEQQAEHWPLESWGGGAGAGCWLCWVPGRGRQYADFCLVCSL